MIKKIVAALFFSLALPCLAYGVSLIGSGIEVSSGDECDGYIICQNFEGTGADNGEVWTFNATANPDYSADSTYIPRGLQSLMIDYDNASAVASTSYAPVGEFWVHFRLVYSSLPGIYLKLFEMYDDSGETEQVVKLTYAGNPENMLRLYIGSTLNPGSYAMVVGTDYHVWLHVDLVNHTGEVYMGTTTIRPELPVVTGNSGDNTSTTTEFFRFIGRSWGSSGQGFFIDQVLLKDTEFTTVKP